MRITETTPPPAPRPPREFTLVVSEPELLVINGVLGKTIDMEGYRLYCAVNRIVRGL